MSATITDEDRAAAHALFKRVTSRDCVGTTDVAAMSCADLAQLAADVREHERIAAINLIGREMIGKGDAKLARRLVDAIAARRSK